MKRARLVYWAVAVGLALVALCGIVNDRYNATWFASDMEAQGGRISSVSRYAFPEDTEPGLFITGPVVDLKAGEYTVTVRYTVDVGSTGNRVDILGGTGDAKYVLASQEFGDGTEDLIFALTLPQREVELTFATYYGGGPPFSVHSYSVQSPSPYFTDSIFLALAVLLAAFVFDRLLFAKALTPGETLQKRLYACWPALFVLLLALFISYPMFRDFLSKAHDLQFHLTRINGIAEGLRSGQFPVRVHPASLGGRGYAAPLLYPELFLYPFALLRLAGVSLVSCMQALCFFINLGSAAFAYLFGRRLFASRWGGAVLALLYTLAPYRVTNMYVRAAIGEALGMMFLPLVALGLYEIFFGEWKRWPVALAGYFGLVQSHILSVFIVGLFSLAFGAVFLYRLVWEKQRLLALGKAAGLTVLLCVGFLVPFLYMNFTQPLRAVDNTYIDFLWQSALYPAQMLLDDVQVRGHSRSLGAIDSMPLNPGVVLVLCAGAAGLLLLLRRFGSSEKKLRNTGLFAFVLAVFSLWLTSTLFPWRLIQHLPAVGPFFGNIQFVWRFLSIASLGLAMCGAFAAVALRPAQKALFPLLLAGLFLVSIAPRYIIDKHINDSDLLITKYTSLDVANSWLHLGEGEYIYEGVDPTALLETSQMPEPEGGTLLVSDYSRQGSNLHFSYSAGQAPAVVDVPLTWYPGYTATDEAGNTIPNQRAPDGRVRLTLTAAQGSVSVRYTGLWWFRLGDGVSLATALAIGGWVLYTQLRRRRQGGGPRPAPAAKPG